MNRIVRFAKLMRERQLANISLSRGAVAAAARRIDLTNPQTWEMAVFSQNGEDGIVDVLLSQLPSKNKYFLEIGASTGMENNSSYLAVVHRFKGVMVEGSPANSRLCEDVIGGLCTKDVVKFVSMFVTNETVPGLVNSLLYKNPDFFSLDIDGNDYYIAQEILRGGLRPKIVSVEFNSAFGPIARRTICYRADFVATEAHRTGLYHGCSIALWRAFWEANGYYFVCVETNGVNAFFVDETCFDASFLRGIKGLEFAENVLSHHRFGGTWEQQFNMIKDLPYHEPASS